MVKGVADLLLWDRSPGGPCCHLEVVGGVKVLHGEAGFQHAVEVLDDVEIWAVARPISVEDHVYFQVFDEVLGALSSVRGPGVVEEEELVLAGNWGEGALQ